MVQCDTVRHCTLWIQLLFVLQFIPVLKFQLQRCSSLQKAWRAVIQATQFLLGENNPCSNPSTLHAGWLFTYRNRNCKKSFFTSTTSVLDLPAFHVVSSLPRSAWFSLIGPQVVGGWMSWPSSGEPWTVPSHLKNHEKEERVKAA